MISGFGVSSGFGVGRVAFAVLSDSIDFPAAESGGPMTDLGVTLVVGAASGAADIFGASDDMTTGACSAGVAGSAFSPVFVASAVFASVATGETTGAAA
jgi:hypothetical protein